VVDAHGWPKPLLAERLEGVPRNVADVALYHVIPVLRWTGYVE
jgi:hypothetical protein